MKKKITWIVILLVVAAGIAGYMAKAGGNAVAVESAAVTRGDIEEYIEETANLMLEEETVIYSTAAGKVAGEVKKAGETVKAGEILLLIENDLDLQIKALEAQKLSVAAQYAEVRDTADSDELRKLEADVRAREAAYEEAKAAADKNKVLYEAGAISLDTLKSSQTKLVVAEAALEAARSSYSSAQKGASENVKRQYEAQLSEIQARIDQLKKKAEEMIVRAPMDGLITASEVKKGSIVQMGTKLFEIAGSKGFYLESDILTDDIALVELGAPVVIEEEDLGITGMKGKVRKIYPKAFSKISELGIEQKRVKIEIELENIPENIRPGYDMTARIVTRSRKHALLIDEKALFEYQDKDCVFVNEGGRAALRIVEKGLESDDKVEITKGLEEGEIVILSPDDTIKEGMRIKVL